METVILPHFPDRPLQICLVKDVQNANFLRQQLLDGNTEFEYAFLDATILLSRNHILAACFRALNDLTYDRLKSRNVHSEIVFSLSPNNNVSPKHNTCESVNFLFAPHFTEVQILDLSWSRQNLRDVFHDSVAGACGADVKFQTDVDHL